MPDKVLVHLRESAIVRMRTLECGLSGLWSVDSGQWTVGLSVECFAMARLIIKDIFLNGHHFGLGQLIAWPKEECQCQCI